MSSSNVRRRASSYRDGFTCESTTKSRRRGDEGSFPLKGVRRFVAGNCSRVIRKLPRKPRTSLGGRLMSWNVESTFPAAAGGGDRSGAPPPTLSSRAVNAGGPRRRTDERGPSIRAERTMDAGAPDDSPPGPPFPLPNLTLVRRTVGAYRFAVQTIKGKERETNKPRERHCRTAIQQTNATRDRCDRGL
ncbi:hypothetical protein NL676_020654 [Syzygium grande]|nr:hypothetical protein NL676_020654 [Syzygium grande]